MGKQPDGQDTEKAHLRQELTLAIQRGDNYLAKLDNEMWDRSAKDVQLMALRRELTAANAVVEAVKSNENMLLAVCRGELLQDGAEAWGTRIMDAVLGYDSKPQGGDDGNP